MTINDRNNRRMMQLDDVNWRNCWNPKKKAWRWQPWMLKVRSVNRLLLLPLVLLGVPGARPYGELKVPWLTRSCRSLAPFLSFFPAPPPLALFWDRPITFAQIIKATIINLQAFWWRRTYSSALKLLWCASGSLCFYPPYYACIHVWNCKRPHTLVAQGLIH